MRWGRGSGGSCLPDSEELLRVPPNPTGAQGLGGSWPPFPRGRRGVCKAEPHRFTRWVHHPPCSVSSLTHARVGTRREVPFCPL